MRPLPSFALMLGLFAAIACRPATTPDDPAVIAVEPAHVDRASVQVSGPAPAQASARVEGVVGDGCSTLVRPIQQKRDGNRILLTVLRQRPKGALCIQIAVPFDETVPLEGTFPTGSYELKANDVVAPFVVQ